MQGEKNPVDRQTNCYHNYRDCHGDVHNEDDCNDDNNEGRESPFKHLG